MYEEIGEGAEELDLGGSKVNMRAYCSWFNFKGADQQKKLSVLSGGERNRLQLAKASATRCLGLCMAWALFLGRHAPYLLLSAGQDNGPIPAHCSASHGTCLMTVGLLGASCVSGSTHPALSGKDGRPLLLLPAGPEEDRQSSAAGENFYEQNLLAGINPWHQALLPHRSCPLLLQLKRALMSTG